MRREYKYIADESLLVTIDRLKKQNAALLTSCVAMMKYMEEGFLVRNTRNDEKNDWALTALQFVKDIIAMHSAIASAEDK